MTESPGLQALVDQLNAHGEAIYEACEAWMDAWANEPHDPAALARAQTDLARKLVQAEELFDRFQELGSA